MVLLRMHVVYNKNLLQDIKMLTDFQNISTLEMLHSLLLR